MVFEANRPGQHQPRTSATKRTGSDFPVPIVTAIEMVKNGHDDTGPNPGYQRNILNRRLERLHSGFEEIFRVAPQLVPECIIREKAAIEAVLQDHPL